MLANDIQFHFFADLAENDMQRDDNVVVASHGRTFAQCHSRLIDFYLTVLLVPHWVLEDYEDFKNDEKESHLRELIKSFLKHRVRLRL